MYAQSVSALLVLVHLELAMLQEKERTEQTVLCVVRWIKARGQIMLGFPVGFTAAKRTVRSIWITGMSVSLTVSVSLDTEVSRQG